MFLLILNSLFNNKDKLIHGTKIYMFGNNFYHKFIVVFIDL